MGRYRRFPHKWNPHDWIYGQSLTKGLRAFVIINFGGIQSLRIWNLCEGSVIECYEQSTLPRSIQTFYKGKPLC